jgi:putative restriction endonuclease
MVKGREASREEVLARFAGLRLHQRDGHRSPHKPLLVLLALGRLAATGSSALPWSQTEAQLGNLIAEFGPAAQESRRQRAAYPFTRLRRDGVWVLDRDVPEDTIGTLAAEPVTGRFDPEVEKILAEDPGLRASVARAMVDSH